VLDARGTGMPVIIHWGADLGDVSLDSLADALVPAVGPSSIDTPFRPGLVPLLADGWSGRPGLAGHAGPLNTTAFDLSGVDASRDSLVVRLSSTAGAVPLDVAVHLALGAEGVLRQRLTVTNRGDEPFALASADLSLPVPARARETLDLTGRWPRERQPQRRVLAHGTWSRDSRHGRPGHDAPLLLAVGEPGFGFRHGEVWAVHVAHSGDQRSWVDASAMGHTLLGAGELLAPGEISLAPGETYSSPEIVAVHSVAGLDGLAHRLHRELRARHPLGPRKVMLNTWEAVYFDHDLPRLTALADAAAAVGVERFVLDDGWMTGRVDDRRALGDWTVDTEKWPDGLGPLIDHVHARGMDFGLWVEPEMVSLDSAVAREHPDWVLGADRPSWRFQYVLDLANPDAFAHVHGQLRALLQEYAIAYLKWDQNRDMLGGSAHRQVEATYRLMAALREEFPGLEIESCSSGGGRVDLGVLEHTDRVWPSDTNDALERQAIHRWTVGLVAPEFLGVHLGAGTAHTSGRTHQLGFRLATALFGHAGIEWDLTTASPAEQQAIARWIEVYKAERGLLHSGDLVRLDAEDESRAVHGVVATDGSAAVFSVVQLVASETAVPGPTRFGGLDPARDYRVALLDVGAPAKYIQDAPPPWIADGVTLSGALLMTVGLPMPLLLPEQALTLKLLALS